MSKLMYVCATLRHENQSKKIEASYTCTMLTLHNYAEPPEPCVRSHDANYLHTAIK